MRVLSLLVVGIAEATCILSFLAVGVFFAAYFAEVLK